MIYQIIPLHESPSFRLVINELNTKVTLSRFLVLGWKVDREVVREKVQFRRIANPTEHQLDERLTIPSQPPLSNGRRQVVAVRADLQSGHIGYKQQKMLTSFLVKQIK